MFLLYVQDQLKSVSQIILHVLQESDGGASSGVEPSFPTIPPSAVMRHNSISSEDSHASHASIATSEAEFGQVEHDFSSVNYRKLTKVRTRLFDFFLLKHVNFTTIAKS